MYGYPFSLTLNSSATNDNSIQFQFQFICVRHLVQPNLQNKLKQLYDPKSNQKRLMSDPDNGLAQAYFNARMELEDASNKVPPNTSEIEAAEKKYRQALESLTSGQTVGEDISSGWLQLFKVQS